MMTIKLLTEHPASVGESYWQHMRKASVFGARLLAVGLACLIHAILPFMFVNTGSNSIHEIHNQLEQRFQARRSQPEL